MHSTTARRRHALDMTDLDLVRSICSLYVQKFTVGEVAHRVGYPVAEVRAALRYRGFAA